MCRFYAIELVQGSLTMFDEASEGLQFLISIDGRSQAMVVWHPEVASMYSSMVV